MELSEKKLIHFIDSFYTNHLLDFYSYKKLRIAIHFYYHDVCYRELDKYSFYSSIYSRRFGRKIFRRGVL